MQKRSLYRGETSGITVIHRVSLETGCHSKGWKESAEKVVVRRRP